MTPREALAELLKDKPNNKIACLDVLAHEVEINEILLKHLQVIMEGGTCETIEAVSSHGKFIYPFDNNKSTTNQDEFNEIETWIFGKYLK